MGSGLWRVLGSWFLFSSAQWMFMVASGVAAYEEGGAGAVGVVAVARLVPALLAAPVAGSLVDRLDRGRVVAGSCALAALAFAVGALVVSDDLRYHAIRALGRLHAEAAAPELERLYPRATGHERLEIVAALIRIGAPTLLAFLKARLHDAEPEVRRVAADGVARVAPASELPLLVQLAQDPDWSVRNHAGWGLGRLGLAGGREALLALVRDMEPVVARTARSALTKLPPN